MKVILLETTSDIDSELVMRFSVTAPLVWWNDFLTSRIGDFGKFDIYYHILKNEFTLGDFEYDGIVDYGVPEARIGNDEARYLHARAMALVISSLNGARARYLDYMSRVKNLSADAFWIDKAKEAFSQIRVLLPQSYLIRGDILVFEKDFQKISVFATISPNWKELHESIMRALKGDKTNET